MGQLLNDKRIRQLAVAVLVVILALGLLSLVSTVFQMIVPLALVIGGAFAFYKIVLEGRDTSDAMEDEVAESSGLDAGDIVLDTPDDAIDDDEAEALERLSAAERAQSEYLDSATPAEEILEQIRARKKRLDGDDDA
jgi:hypothetical protein